MLELSTADCFILLRNAQILTLTAKNGLLWASVSTTPSGWIATAVNRVISALMPAKACPSAASHRLEEKQKYETGFSSARYIINVYILFGVANMFIVHANPPRLESLAVARLYMILTVSYLLKRYTLYVQITVDSGFVT